MKRAALTEGQTALVQKYLRIQQEAEQRMQELLRMAVPDDGDYTFDLQAMEFVPVEQETD